MCGLVGFTGETPAPEILAAAAAAAGRRGPHSWGWIDADGDLRRGLGPMTASSLVGIRGPGIGHSRLATSTARAGDAPPLEETQPFARDGWALAHNGTVPNREELEEIRGRVVVDSLLLLLALVETGDVDAAVAGISDDAPLTALILSPAREISAVRRPGRRRGPHPLYVLRRPEGDYVCSRPFAAGASPLPEGHSRL